MLTGFGLSTSAIISKEGVKEYTYLRDSLSFLFLDLTLLPMEDGSRGWLGIEFLQTLGRTPASGSPLGDTPVPR
ncbi:hypothetical protein F2Q68_00039807 [Brassica cretica]|uniref:Uncharacterized protein n=1 Tax=Brassica cretica TaxID=69181 RepID=A0A8S9MGW3_BRACR|nr:hypothetical protein F2Q68_00039807 [Brassica cretica]